MTVNTNEELAIYDEVTQLGASLWDVSLKVVGLNQDPKMFSVMLFKRLWSNYRGYMLLHNNAFSLEADIILRAGLEAAICIAANYELPDEFVVLIRSDAAFTLKGQIKMFREIDSTDLVKKSEAALRSLMANLPEGIKPAKLNLRNLAKIGKISDFYNAYRQLSGVSLHTTGLSVLNGVVDADSSENSKIVIKDRLNSKIIIKDHLRWMVGATLQGSKWHAAMIDDDEHFHAAKKLIGQLNVISMKWS